MVDNNADPKDTHRLDTRTDILSIVEWHPFGTKPDSTINAGYITLPLGAQRKEIAWRLVLEIAGKSAGLLPLEIVDDVVIGRGTGDEGPQLDLTALDAFEHGISRRHAMLRPARGNLYLMDLGSSNGTYVNGVQMGRGIAQGLNHQDTIALGKLRMTVFSIERLPLPGSVEEKAEEKKPAPTPKPPVMPPRRIVPRADPTKPIGPDDMAEVLNDVEKKPVPEPEPEPEPEKPVSTEAEKTPIPDAVDRVSARDILRALEALKESNPPASKETDESEDSDAS